MIAAVENALLAVVHVIVPANITVVVVLLVAALALTIVVVRVLILAVIHVANPVNHNAHHATDVVRAEVVIIHVV